MLQTFFSYSRTDAEFALRLANDLRAAGIDIWMDQLDIEPGARWDAAIQDALEESHDLIVVLSPKAVASENIMDEVSFALENGRKVYPVLIEECEIPFRLKRLQYISFLESYEEGYRRLRAILDLPENKTAGTGDKPSGSITESRSAGQANQRRKRIIIGLALFVVLMTALLSFRQFFKKGDNATSEAPKAGFIPGLYKANPNGRGQYYVLNFMPNGKVSASDWLTGRDSMTKEKLIELSNWIPACPYRSTGDSVLFNFRDGGYDESYQCLSSDANVLRCNRKAVDGTLTEDVLTLVP